MTWVTWDLPAPCSTLRCLSDSPCGQFGTPLCREEVNGWAALWLFGGPSAPTATWLRRASQRLSSLAARTMFTTRERVTYPPSLGHTKAVPALPGPAPRPRAGLCVLIPLTPFASLCRRFTPTPGGWPSFLSSEEVLASALSSLCLQGAVLRDLSGRPQRRWALPLCLPLPFPRWPADAYLGALV